LKLPFPQSLSINGCRLFDEYFGNLLVLVDYGQVEWRVAVRIGLVKLVYLFMHLIEILTKFGFELHRQNNHTKN
jgi:hypothetical protein